MNETVLPRVILMDQRLTKSITNHKKSGFKPSRQISILTKNCLWLRNYNVIN